MAGMLCAAKVRRPGTYGDWKRPLVCARPESSAPSKNVLRSFNLGCNAIALNVRTGIFTDAGAIDSIRKKRLTFADYAIRHSHATFAAKALMLHLNMQYKVPLEVGEFIQTYLQPAELLYESKKIFPGLVPLQSTKI